MPWAASARARATTRAVGRRTRFMTSSRVRWRALGCCLILRFTGPDGSPATPRAAILLLAAAGDLQADEGAGQGGHRPDVVDLFLGGVAGQPALGSLARALGAGPIDLGGCLGDVGQDDHLVVA